MPSRRPDIVVAGGGPAGLATAIHARLAGFDVRVFEPRPTPIDKACGEGLMPCAVRMLRDELGVEELPGRPFDGIRYTDGVRSADARFANGERGRGVRRTELHTALTERLAQLEIPVDPDRITSVEQDSAGVRVRTAAGLEYEATWLVAADGLHSPIRRRSGLDRPPARHGTRFGLRRHFRVRPWSDLVEVHWAERAEAYVTPIDDNTVGVAILTMEREPYDAQLPAFPGLSERLGDTLTDVRGAGPLRQRATSPVDGRVLLVGDAAGYVDALTGEGLSIAFRSARELVRCLEAQRPQDYARAWHRATRAYRMITSALLWTRRRPALAPLIVPAARRLPRVFARAVDILAR